MSIHHLLQDRAFPIFARLESYCERFQLSTRVIDGGWRSAFCTAMRIIYRLDTTGRDARRHRWHFFRNALLTRRARLRGRLVPPSEGARCATRYWLSHPPDNYGPFIAARDGAADMASVAGIRKPLQLQSLRGHCRLRRTPQPSSSNTWMTPR
jgi:hypothetical protein